MLVFLSCGFIPNSRRLRRASDDHVGFTNVTYVFFTYRATLASSHPMYGNVLRGSVVLLVLFRLSFFISTNSPQPHDLHDLLVLEIDSIAIEVRLEITSVSRNSCRQWLESRRSKAKGHTYFMIVGFIQRWRWRYSRSGRTCWGKTLCTRKPPDACFAAVVLFSI